MSNNSTDIENYINSEEFKSLTTEEQSAVFSVLKEMSNNDGDSKLYSDLLYADYKEIPVDIETFLTDDMYLGKAWKDESGKSKLYPFWLETLKKLFPTNIDTAYDTLLETGARGIGKSEVGCGAVGAYLMYRIMCLKNPQEFYHLKPTEKICFAFMNIKKELAKQIAIDKFQKTIQMSPWFMKTGRMTTFEGEPYWIPPNYIEIIIGSQSDDVIGLPIFFCFQDEISFIRNKDIDEQKKKAKDMIDTAIGGMLTRFVHNGKNPTMLVVASSKRSEQSFMEQYIRMLSEGENKSKVYIVDKPVWEVKPVGTYGEGTFYVGLGNKFLSSIVIPDEDNDKLDTYRQKGYKIIEVPRFFRAKFLEDTDRNLCDIAGISVTSSSKYMSAELVRSAIDTTFKNPFPDIIETGNAQDDLLQYRECFDMSSVPKELMSKPLFVHLDISVSGDMTGIAGVWIIGKRTSTDSNQSKDLAFRLAFSTSIKAPKGYQVSFQKNRNFIRWLRDVGFNVKKISYDTFQSYDTGQQLKAEGFDCMILSVDRVDTDRICKPYQYIKNAITEKRFTMYKSERLFEEFIDVERNINTGKVDHTRNGHKDALDAVTGATFVASQYAEEFAYDYGESFEVVDVVNKCNVMDAQQLVLDFEEELKNIHTPTTKSVDNTTPQTKKDNIPYNWYLSQGIIL